MLEISNIKKDYELKDQSVHALKGINICFRRSEFVSILGPSGCGKTTLLNIIGGLDRYTSGDLLIDGVSTREFKDKDWDNYRNHRVGFVFQNYNLIAHQTILSNVELALTLSGIKPKERKARAIEVLEKVGLGDKINSKPNQLSGGQMQRVAIARALVNDPEIILADEPTGALDSKTSVQIMDILKEVSQDRLVIMVTHNPELAAKYSSRIVNLLDGELINDSKPYSKKEADKEIKKHNDSVLKSKSSDKSFNKTEKKKSMSFFTALALSFKNLLTKKGRTIMVAFAGSIGIVGIALILAVSNGMTNYINNMQSDSLSSYPVAVSSVAIDMDNVMMTMSGDMSMEDNSSDDEIKVYDRADEIINIIVENKLGRYNYLDKKFVSYLKEHYDTNKSSEDLNDFVISYASDMHLITNDPKVDSSLVPINSTVTTSALDGQSSSIFFEQLNEEYVRSMYDVIGNFPKQRGEIALVVGESGLSLSELDSYGIGYNLDDKGNPQNIKYNDILNKKSYTLLFNNGYFDETTLQPVYDFSKYITTGENGETIIDPNGQDKLRALKTSLNENNSIELTISCILQLKKDMNGEIFNNGLMYTHELADLYNNTNRNSTIATKVRNLFKDKQGDEFNTIEFPVKYDLRISEVPMGTLTFSHPNEMNHLLSTAFNYTLTNSQIEELYLQMYGASEVPTGIYFYVKNFDAKENIKNLIKEWNEDKSHLQITVTDSSEMLTGMLSTLVDAVTYVLVAFAGISLVVSSIMIGIITYTSVIERTKEIGILRSIGASKRDVSNVFNAETILIGLTSGLLGILISSILCIPIGAILKILTDVKGLAVMNPVSSIALILISVVLTFIAGLIPARIASKKDPVIALRTE